MSRSTAGARIRSPGQWRVKVANPFEDENGVYHVLINDEGQHSLWPTFIEIPDGWRIIHKSDTRAACLEFINKNWTDMRPNSLIESMKALPASGQQISPQGEPSGGELTPDTKTIH
jgi:MbtH protein